MKICFWLAQIPFLCNMYIQGLHYLWLNPATKMVILWNIIFNSKNTYLVVIAQSYTYFNYLHSVAVNFLKNAIAKLGAYLKY